MPKSRCWTVAAVASVAALAGCHSGRNIAVRPDPVPPRITFDGVTSTTFGWTARLVLPEAGYLAVFSIMDGQLLRVLPERGATPRQPSGPRAIAIAAASHPASLGLPYGSRTSSSPTCAYQVRDGSSAGYRCMPGAVSLGHLTTADAPLIALLFDTPVEASQIDSTLYPTRGAGPDDQLAALQRVLRPRLMGGWAAGQDRRGAP